MYSTVQTGSGELRMGQEKEDKSVQSDLVSDSWFYNDAGKLLPKLDK